VSVEHSIMYHRVPCSDIAAIMSMFARESVSG